MPNIIMNKIISECHLCQAKNLFVFSQYQVFFRVTSDCKPWHKGGELALCQSCYTLQKVITPAYIDELDLIYKDYSIYYQAKGKEQCYIEQNQGISVARSEYIIDLISNESALPYKGKILDFGCGNGSFLKTFNKHFPHWSLSGFEQNNQTKHHVESITGVQHFYSGDIGDVNEKFDLIVLFHTLEHIINPVKLLTVLKSKLTRNGSLLIVVPHYINNPFDLLIADHCSHFSTASLQYLLELCGFEILIITHTSHEKEITILARVGKDNSAAAVNSAVVNSIAQIKQQIYWLQETEKLFLQLGSDSERTLGIMGTSIAANWLLAINDKIIDFFVDEDVNRINQRIHGKKVIKPADIATDSNIYLPFPAILSAKIYHRLKKYPGHFYPTPKYTLPPIK